MAKPKNKLSKYSNNALRNLVALGEKMLLIQRFRDMDPRDVYQREETEEALGQAATKDWQWNYEWMIHEAHIDRLMEVYKLFVQYNINKSVPDG